MTRRSNSRVGHNLALILGGSAFFALVGFFLPFVLFYVAASIVANVDPNSGPVQMRQVPMELSVLLAVILGTGAAVGLTLQVVFKRSGSASSRRRF